MRSGELAVCAGVERTAGDVSCRLLNFLEFARRPSSGRRWSPSVKTRIVFVFTQAAGPGRNTCDSARRVLGAWPWPPAAKGFNFNR